MGTLPLPKTSLSLPCKFWKSRLITNSVNSVWLHSSYQLGLKENSNLDWTESKEIKPFDSTSVATTLNSHESTLPPINVSIDPFTVESAWWVIRTSKTKWAVLCTGFYKKVFNFWHNLTWVISRRFQNQAQENPWKASSISPWIKMKCCLQQRALSTILQPAQIQIWLCFSCVWARKAEQLYRRNIG